ncbi:energy-coupling factor transporter transmembrane component T [Arthrobacter sp. H14]|uniref:energy-coupling factor transporter transmembrane component T n=1 Tax=Arthrobacter sp. H14 TaxID=1312959 RepID=UPI0004AFAEEA|nr:energy-coupling factor transporter transmembrane component T [Arthrobacter sp. H14]
MRVRRRIFNPLTELTLAALFVVLVLVINNWRFSLAVLLLVVFPAAVTSGRAGRIAVVFGVLVGPMLLFLLLLHGLFFPEGATVLLDLGIAAVTAEGLLFALSMGTRIAAFAGLLLTAVLSMDVSELLATLTHRRWNRKLVFVLGAALGLAPLVSERATEIMKAQRARGLVVTRNPLSKLRALVMVGRPLIAGLLIDAGDRSRTLEARGFAGTVPRTSYRADTDTTVQRTVRWVMLAAVVVFSIWWYIGRAG